jgi:hypothetical protein
MYRVIWFWFLSNLSNRRSVPASEWRPRGAIRQEPQALHELFSETHVGGIGFVTRYPGIDELSPEQLIRCKAAQQLEFFCR